jgi:hypothetical protein
MTGKVVRDNEVELNSIRYPLAGDGQIHPILATQFAPKQVIGDYSLDSDPDKSYWSISNGSGGIGVEELLKTSQINRSYFTNCNVKYPGHLFLSNLATSITLPASLVITNSDMELNANWTTETGTAARSSAQAQAGTYSWALGNTGADTLVYQDITVTAALIQGATITIGGYGYVPTGGSGAYIGLDDGVSTTWSDNTVGNDAWAGLTVTKKFAATATRIRIYLKVPTVSGLGYSGFLDTLTTTIFNVSSPLKFCEFNNKLYLAIGNTLLKLNATGDGFVYVAAFTPSITELVASVNDCLYIGLGTTAYQYMSTAETFTATNVGNMNKAIHWDNKLNKISSVGQMSYTATPNSATPSWSNKGLLDTNSFGTINNLVTYTDAAGADTIYATTTRGLFAHDYTNALWENTQLQLPQHTDNGKGVVVQNGKLYYSAGLSVYEYSLNSGALSINNVGLDADDGLPDEYVGSISRFVGGFEGAFYALVDASLISSSNYSSVVCRTGEGWHPVWLDGTANETMPCGIVSSVYRYALWFIAGSTVYWIALDRAKKNPLKTTTNYSSSGSYYSPKFNAGWQLGNNLASKVRILVQNTTATETVAVKYRVNVLPNTALTTGWTTLGTLVAANDNVEKTYNLASSVGVTFKNIQFALDLARSTATKTPDIRYLTLEYERLVPTRWSWGFIVDCTKEYNGLSGEQLLDALVTAAETETLITLVYKATTKYVRIKSVQGQQLTGNNRKGEYTVLVVEK